MNSSTQSRGQRGLAPHVDPAPAGLDELASRDYRRVAKDGDQIALTTRLYPQYAEPVFFIVERDALYQASQDLGRCACAG
jgi:hypothetical protein